jgi:hypothetical protein
MIRCSVIIFIEDLHKKYGDNIDGLMVSEEWKTIFIPTHTILG